MSRFVRGICFTFLVAATFAARPAYSQQGVAWTWISVAQGAIAVCDNDLWTVAFNNYAGLMGLKGKPPLNIIKVPPEFPKYPIPCNPVAPVPAGGNIKFGISVGAALVTSLPTRSSSEFYDGGIDSNAGMLIGRRRFTTLRDLAPARLHSAIPC